ncbi:MAG: hypothetical protein NZ700_15290, partial [Gemmataceae bacterium]|nr:hypothetical protein [Gemmataceae bacterium]MDW8266422.1 hypothetical protein [Gemmataceae bacterium]
MKGRRWLVVVLAVAGGTSLAAGDGPEPLRVTDTADKVHVLKNWKITLGTRRLDWLVPGESRPGGGNNAAVAGPEALVLREDDSMNPPLVQGITTLLPLEHVRAVRFDAEKQSMTVELMSGPEAVHEVRGPTKYKDVNKLVIEAETDLGTLGVAEAKFIGGTSKGTIKSLAFPRPKALPVLDNLPVTIVANDKAQTVHKAADVQPLYRRADGRHVALPFVVFKKAVKVELAKLSRLR